MSETPQKSTETPNELSVDAQKDNAQAAAQLDALLHTKKTDGVSRLRSLRHSTEGIETQVSKMNSTVEHLAVNENSVDV